MKTKKKFDWNILLASISTIAAMVSIIVAINANLQSEKSLKLAEEANQISLSSQLPKIQVNRLFRYRAYVDDYKDPCLSNFGGGAIWYIESANGFDVTNSGGKAISVVEVTGSEIETFGQGISAKVDFEVFGSKESFDQWFSIRSSPSPLFISEQQYSKFDFSGFPITINPGETVRLLLLGKHSVSFDETYKNSQDVQKVLDGSDWNAQIIFKFGDGTEISDKVPVTYPYQFDPLLVPKEFKQCEQQ